MNHRVLLVTDGIADLVLGIALILARDGAFRLLGLPRPSTFFYTTVLGAVLVGVGVALLIQRFHRAGSASGLGILGATWINICGAGAVIGWLLKGRMGLPTRGLVLLSCIAVAVLAIGVLELVRTARAGRDA